MFPNFNLFFAQTTLKNIKQLNDFFFFILIVIAKNTYFFFFISLQWLFWFITSVMTAATPIPTFIIAPMLFHWGWFNNVGKLARIHNTLYKQ